MTSSHYLLVCALLLCISSSLAATPARPRALFLPVTKDLKTNQYVTEILQRTPLVPVKLTIDIGAENLWVDCENGFKSSTYMPARCGSRACRLAQSTHCADCPTAIRPGCNNRTCHVDAHNTVEHILGLRELAEDVVSLQSTNGKNPTSYVSIPKFIFVCDILDEETGGSLLSGLAEGVTGMAGLGRTSVSLPAQFSSAFRIPEKFAICLGTSKGVMFFGNSPYVLLPPPGTDYSSRLIYTPLIRNPKSMEVSSLEPDTTAQYYIGVDAIKINGKEVPLNKSLLSIDSEGRKGVKISTTSPYTQMVTPIYEAFTKAFIEATSSIPRVNPVGPFKVCYDSKNIQSTRVGPAVPQIDLNLRNNVTWTIFGANSMVQVNQDVLCLAFVEREWFLEDYSIIIGGHQLEDNLLEFDVARSRLGFTSSLLFHRTNCGNFNFSSAA